MISYTYDRVTIDLSENIKVVAFTMNSTQPDRQIIVDYTFASGTNAATINTKIAQIANIVWSLQT